MRRFFASLYRLGKLAEIFDPSVGATSQKYIVDPFAEHLLTAFEIHVGECFGKADLVATAEPFVRGDRLRDADTHTRIGSIGDHRFNVGRIECIFLVELCIGIRSECFPFFDSFVEVGALRSAVTTFDVVERSLVGGDDTAAGTALDTHVADRHTLLHRQVADGLSGKLDEVSGSARSRYF